MLCAAQDNNILVILTMHDNDKIDNGTNSITMQDIRQDGTWPLTIPMLGTLITHIYPHLTAS